MSEFVVVLFILLYESLFLLLLHSLCDLIITYLHVIVVVAIATIMFIWNGLKRRREISLYFTCFKDENALRGVFFFFFLLKKPNSARSANSMKAMWNFHQKFRIISLWPSNVTRNVNFYWTRPVCEFTHAKGREDNFRVRNHEQLKRLLKKYHEAVASWNSFFESSNPGTSWLRMQNSRDGSLSFMVKRVFLFWVFQFLFLFLLGGWASLENLLNLKQKRSKKTCKGELKKK